MFTGVTTSNYGRHRRNLVSSNQDRLHVYKQRLSAPTAVLDSVSKQLGWLYVIVSNIALFFSFVIKLILLVRN